MKGMRYLWNLFRAEKQLISEDFDKWLNCWANSEQHSEWLTSKDWRAGYNRAIRDVRSKTKCPGSPHRLETD